MYIKGGKRERKKARAKEIERCERQMQREREKTASQPVREKERVGERERERE